MSERKGPNERLAAAFAAFDAAKKAASKPASPNSPEARVLHLTDAISYSTDVTLKLHEGFAVKRCGCSNPHCAGKDLCIAVTREKILDVFTTLVHSFEGIVKPSVIRPFHHRRQTQYSRNPLDASVLLSMLESYDKVLLNDGYSLFCVENEERDASVQILPERMILVKTIPQKVAEFRAILTSLGIPEKPRMETILDHQDQLKYETSSPLESDFVEMLQELSLEEEDPYDPTNHQYDSEGDE